MLKITMVYEAQLREVAGQAEAVIDAEGVGSLLELLQHVAGQNEQLRPRLLAENGELLPSLLVFVNDQPVEHSAAAARSLADGDTVLLLPPISGG
ncbi:MAG: MoaD/ThiS family protein [Planctomycetaceae bacterium]|nr:MoaD/ThiS family protein [Planctomycetaceae bacterium]